MLNMLDFITSKMDKKQFPFEEGDDYWVVVGDKVLGSVWDSESEEMYDPRVCYYDSEERANQAVLRTRELRGVYHPALVWSERDVAQIIEHMHEVGAIEDGDFYVMIGMDNDWKRMVMQEAIGRVEEKLCEMVNNSIWDIIKIANSDGGV